MQILVHAYSTLMLPPQLSFPHRAAGHQSWQDSSLGSHLRRLARYCTADGTRPVPPLLMQVLLHFSRTRHHFSFEIAQDDFAALSQWAHDANAVLHLPDGTIRDPHGLVLVDPATGQPEADASMPVTTDALVRKRNSEQSLRNRSIDVDGDLPCYVGQSEALWRGGDDVAWRCLALLAVALRAESLSIGRPLSRAALRAKLPLAFQAVTAWEDDFLANEFPTEPNLAIASWRYESLNVLQWSLGWQDTLAFPDDLCDVPRVAEVGLQHNSATSIASASLRDAADILDAADLNYRMLWAARHAAHLGLSPPAAIDGNVLIQRQQAFNWLAGFDDQGGNVGWEQVSTST